MDPTMPNEIPPGTPFSRAYLAPARPLKDDTKFRRRLSALFSAHKLAETSMPVLAHHLKLYGGIEVPIGSWGYAWDAFFKRSPISDVLDAIGLIADGLTSCMNGSANGWKLTVSKILAEQSMGYRLDDKGAVRKLVDEEFHRHQFAALAGLGKQKFKTAGEFFEKASAAIEADPTETAGMVRYTFFAVEEVFKLMFGVERLTAGTVRNHFLPERAMETNPAKVAAQEMANSFAKWVAAAQQYRHAPGEVHEGEESPAAPPFDLAIVMMSSGASYLRWLVAVDGA